MHIVLWFQTKLPARPEVTRGDPLTSQQWSKHMDKEGKIINVEEVKDQIFRGVRNGFYLFLGLCNFPLDWYNKIWMFYSLKGRCKKIYLQGLRLSYTVELWSLELACLEHQGSLELVRRPRQFPHTFNVQIHPRLEQRWLELSNSKHGPQGDFFM